MLVTQDGAHYYENAGSSSDGGHSPRATGRSNKKELSPQEIKQRLERRRWNRYIKKLKSEQMNVRGYFQNNYYWHTFQTKIKDNNFVDSETQKQLEIVKHGKELTPNQRMLLERFDNLNLMHVMDDSLSYIEDLTKKYDGNLNQFLDEARN